MILSIHNLEHRVGVRTVLRIDALDFAPGQVTGIVGPNGSGKSTLLRLMAFLDVPTNGFLRLDGQTIESTGERRRARQRVTLVEQHPLLFDGTVRDNLLLPLRARKRTRIDVDTRVRTALGRTGAEPLLHRRARALSGGETQRVAIARALLTEADVLLLDEPASGGDPSLLADLATVLAEETARGATIVLSSHQIEAAYRWSDTIVALSDGRLAPAALENLFRVTLEPGGGTRTVRAGPLDLVIVTDRTGPVTLSIPPESVIVSPGPLRSSARNQFSGRIVRLSEHRDGAITLTADVGTLLHARITPSAFEELGLSIGDEAVLSVKAVAVQVV